MNNKKTKKMVMGKSGFTMIELIFVTVISGILGIAAISNFNDLEESTKEVSKQLYSKQLINTIAMLDNERKLRNK